MLLHSKLFAGWLSFYNARDSQMSKKYDTFLENMERLRRQGARLLAASQKRTNPVKTAFTAIPL